MKYRVLLDETGSWVAEVRHWFRWQRLGRFRAEGQAVDCVKEHARKVPQVRYFDSAGNERHVDTLS